MDIILQRRTWSDKKALINPRSKDGGCFFDAVVISANLEYFKNTKNPGRIAPTVRDMRYEFNFNGLVPPYIDFELFEDNNPTDKLNVYIEHPERKGTIKQEYIYLKMMMEKD